MNGGGNFVIGHHDLSLPDSHSNTSFSPCRLRYQGTDVLICVKFVISTTTDVFILRGGVDQLCRRDAEDSQKLAR